MANGAAIEIGGLSKRFGSVRAVSDMSFRVDAGRVIGIQDLPLEDAGLPDDVDVLSPGLAVLAMLASIAAVFAPGAALLIRRDLD